MNSKLFNQLIPQSSIPTGELDLEDEHVDFEEVVGLVTPRGGSMNPFMESAHGVPKPAPVYHTAREADNEEEYRSESSLSVIMVDNMPVSMKCPTDSHILN